MKTVGEIYNFCSKNSSLITRANAFATYENFIWLKATGREINVQFIKNKIVIEMKILDRHKDQNAFQDRKLLLDFILS